MVLIEIKIEIEIRQFRIISCDNTDGQFHHDDRTIKCKDDIINELLTSGQRRNRNPVALILTQRPKSSLVFSIVLSLLFPPTRGTNKFL